MLKKLSFLLVGFFCTGLAVAQAAMMPGPMPQSGMPPQTLSSMPKSTQEMLNEDSFNFIIANPNTADPKRFIFELKPGESASDDVYVKNSSDVPLKFSLYGSDGTKTAQGSFALETRSEQANEVGKWITFDEKELTLQPGEFKKIKFHVTVPGDTPEGTYSGGVSAEKTKADASNPNITIAVRIALRVDVKVTANPHPVAKKYLEMDKNPFYQAYFWASLGLFVLSAGALGWAYYTDRKSPGRKARHAKK